MAILELETGSTSDVDSLLEAALTLQVEELPGGRDEHGNTHVISRDTKLIGAAAIDRYMAPTDKPELYIEGVYTDPAIHDLAYLAVLRQSINDNPDVHIIYGVEDEAVARVAPKIAGCLPIEWRYVDVSEIGESTSHAFMHYHAKHPGHAGLV
jgi:hypothetical protein